MLNVQKIREYSIPITEMNVNAGNVGNDTQQRRL